eukprot:1431340-Rhodomonas_salina.1
MLFGECVPTLSVFSLYCPGTRVPGYPHKGRGGKGYNTVNRTSQVLRGAVTHFTTSCVYHVPLASTEKTPAGQQLSMKIVP